MQRSATGEETGCLGVIRTDDVAHELAHAVPMKVRRAESVLCDEPTGRKDDKIGHGGADRVGRTGKDGKDGRVGMVVRDGAHRVEHHQVVTVGQVVAAKRNNVKRRMVLRIVKCSSHELVDHNVFSFNVFKRCYRRLKVLCVGQSVCPDRTQVRQLKVTFKHFTDISSCSNVGLLARRLCHTELEPTLNDTDVQRRNVKLAEFGRDQKLALDRN